MVRRWTTARKSVAGPRPVFRFQMPYEVDVLIFSLVHDISSFVTVRLKSYVFKSVVKSWLYYKTSLRS